MKSMKMTMFIFSALLVAGTAQARGKIVRATDMGTTMWADLTHGKLGDSVVEFRQGDQLPVSFEAQGDLVETRSTSVGYVVIKKNFWLRLNHSDVEASLDGTEFKKLSDVLFGSLEAGAGSAHSGGLADGINIVFKAFLK